ncbi:MAG: glycosyltransferase, partial [Abitibacteriaceae bacterium]|nr:glycosyltransferase [Abditibacteriaceae bacterium]
LKDAPVYRAPFHGRVEQERFYRDLKRAHWPVAPESGTTRLISVICPLSEVKAATSIADAIGRAAINSHAVSVPYEMIWVWYGEGTCSLPGLVVEHLETPFVYAEAANRGVMASSGEVLLFLNEQGALDTPNALQDLLSLFAEQPGSDVCYVYHSGEWQPRESPDYLDREHECWAIRRHTFCSLGGLKEVATSIEDIELRANSTSTILSLAPQQSTAVLGIGITTYNRLEALAGCVKRIQKHTRHDYQLVIADDGSTDGTVEWARQQGLRIITGENRGLAWNRNRALHYLEEYTRCDPLILLDDDCWPCEDGWEQTWREAALRWGHVDHAFAPSVVKSGRGTAQDPYICSGSSGNCCTTSRAALRVVGYQDLRLAQGWGYDDSEWTMRFSRALAQERDMAPDVQLCLSHGIRMMEFGTWCDQEKLAQNRNVFLELLEEQTVWRPAWQTEGEQETLKGEVIKAIQHRRMQAQNVLYTPRGLIAPTETADCQPRWEGRICPKPWEYTVSAIIPHLETPEPLRTCIEILRLQTERPYIFVVDTGSSAATMTELESLRAADVEIHYIRSHAFRHSSEPVGVAQDLAFALCHSEYLFCTHADCFLRRRDYIEWLLTLCNAECPAVGYQMSPRDWLTNDWEGMVSHTATLLHMPTMWRLGASWNFERAHTQFGVPRQAMGWPDTETCMNMVLQAAGVKPLLIGNETNYERYVDENVDHPRSFAGSKFYGAEYHVKAQTWMEDALREARERIAGWKSGHNI